MTVFGLGVDFDPRLTAGRANVDLAAVLGWFLKLRPDRLLLLADEVVFLHQAFLCYPAACSYCPMP